MKIQDALKAAKDAADKKVAAATALAEAAAVKYRKLTVGGAKLTSAARQAQLETLTEKEKVEMARKLHKIQRLEDDAKAEAEKLEAKAEHEADSATAKAEASEEASEEAVAAAHKLAEEQIAAAKAEALQSSDCLHES